MPAEGRGVFGGHSASGGFSPFSTGLRPTCRASAARSPLPPCPGSRDSAFPSRGPPNGSSPCRKSGAPLSFRSCRGPFPPRARQSRTREGTLPRSLASLPRSSGFAVGKLRLRPLLLPFSGGGGAICFRCSFPPPFASGKVGSSVLASCVFESVCPRLLLVFPHVGRPGRLRRFHPRKIKRCFRGPG